MAVQTLIQSPLGADLPNAVLQWVIPVDLNSDGRDDFILQYWQQAPEPGVKLSAPTRDVLFAMLSQPDGSYKPDNLAIFGSPTPGLGGASRKYVEGDINGDGVTDYAFAMNSEDGRSGDDANTNEARPAVLLSKPGGKYEVVNLGQASWGHSVTLVDNGLGTKDVIFAGFTDPNVQAFRYKNGNFTDVTASYTGSTEGWAAAMKAVPSSDPTKPSSFIVSTNTVSQMSEGVYQILKNGVALLAKSGGQWQTVDTFYNEAIFKTPWISWTKTEGSVSVYLIDGKYYFSGTFDEILIADKPNADGSVTVIAKMALGAYRYSDVIIEGQKYDEGDVDPVNVLKFFKLKDGHLAPQSGVIALEQTKVLYNYFSLTDINRDGFADLVIQAMTRPGFGTLVDNAGRPIVYINDGTGKYHYVDISALPGNAAGVPAGPEIWGYLNDVDNDGFVDLVTWRSDVAPGGATVQIDFLKQVPGVANGSGDDILYGSANDDVFQGGLGSDVINGGAGNDTVIFADKLADVFISLSGSTVTVRSKTEGIDKLSSIETLVFADQTISTTNLIRDLTPKAYRLVTPPLFVGTIGGSGDIFGTKERQDITIAVQPGVINFDASFNSGGDIIRLEGKASAWTIERAGSVAKLTSESQIVNIPIGAQGLEIAFADGARTLKYAAGVFQIGDQAFSEKAATIVAAGTASPSILIETTSPARLVMSPNGDATIGGNVSIFGVGNSAEKVRVIGGNIGFDASFNTGGDTIYLLGNSNNWSAARSGSSMLLSKGSDSISVPIGILGLDIAFDNATRALLYAGSQFKIGSQTIEGSGATVLIG